MRKSISKSFGRLKLKAGISKKLSPYGMFRVKTSKNTSVSGDTGFKGNRIRGSAWKNNNKITLEHNTTTKQTKIKLKDKKAHY